MKKLYPLLILIAVGAFIFSNCSEESGGGGGTPEPDPTEMELITADTWKIVDKVLNNISIFSTLDACEMDNRILFKTNGSGEYLEGATKCDVNDPQSVSMSWAFLGDSTKMRIDIDSNIVINEITASSLKYTQTKGQDKTMTVFEKTE